MAAAREATENVPGPANGEPEQRLLSRELQRALADAYGKLPHTLQPVFYRRVLAQPPRSNDEIAEELGMNPQTVRVHCHRACQLMRAKLGPILEM